MYGRSTRPIVLRQIPSGAECVHRNPIHRPGIGVPAIAQGTGVDWFGSLTANRETYAAAHKKFAGFWRAKDLLSSLEKINPDYYPMPIQKPQQQPSGIKHCAAVHGSLTKDDFVALYDISGDFLHVRNPFSNQEPVIKMPYNVRQWIERIEALLALHIMHLLNGNVWIAEVPQQGPINMWLAEPRAAQTAV